MEGYGASHPSGMTKVGTSRWILCWLTLWRCMSNWLSGLRCDFSRSPTWRSGGLQRVIAPSSSDSWTIVAITAHTGLCIGHGSNDHRFNLTGFWNDENCSNYRGFLCEIRQVEQASGGSDSKPERLSEHDENIIISILVPVGVAAMSVLGFIIQRKYPNLFKRKSSSTPDQVKYQKPQNSELDFTREQQQCSVTKQWSSIGQTSGPRKALLKFTDFGYTCALHHHT